MIRGLLISIFIAFIFIGCNTSKIDARNKDMMDRSIEEINKSLTDEKKKEFEEALEIILDNQFKISTKWMFTKRVHTDTISYDEQKLLHNKTADEVIAEAKKILDKR